MALEGLLQEVHIVRSKGFPRVLLGKLSFGIPESLEVDPIKEPGRLAVFHDSFRVGCARIHEHSLTTPELNT